MILALVVGALGPGHVFGQDVDFSGFIKAEYLYDTRQVVAARDGALHLYPSAESEATATDNLEGFAFFSRARLGIAGLPDALGAEVNGYLEADFFGPTNDAVSTFRLRRAFVNLAWDNREALFGQEWSPLFTLAAFPRTVAITAGAPFQPFARQPQVRLTLKPDNVRLIGAAAWQIDAFTDITFDETPGTDGGTVSGLRQQQLSALPALHGHVQVHGEGIVVGSGAYLKSLRSFATADRFFAGAAQAYAARSTTIADIRAKATFGTDLTDHLMTGGYVYSTTEEDFFPLRVFSSWIDVDGKGDVAPGFFAGYLINTGSFSEVGSGLNDTATRSPDIRSIWRLAPRLNLTYGAVRFALELEVTSAAYAAAFDENYAPDGDTNAVTNVRGNFSVFLFF